MTTTHQNDPYHHPTKKKIDPFVTDKISHFSCYRKITFFLFYAPPFWIFFVVHVLCVFFRKDFLRDMTTTHQNAPYHHPTKKKIDPFVTYKISHFSCYRKITFFLFYAPPFWILFVVHALCVFFRKDVLRDMTTTHQDAPYHHPTKKNIDPFVIYKISHFSYYRKIIFFLFGRIPIYAVILLFLQHAFGFYLSSTFCVFFSAKDYFSSQ